MGMTAGEFMVARLTARAHARFTGEVGVCMSTSGPGAIHLLNGLYDAKLDRQPVVASSAGNSAAWRAIRSKVS
jgi:thiamine pyrophosphate-dependent acetolactate synthase large subunit-like protein